MTALVSSHSTFLLDPATNPAHNPGILLNARHPTQPRQPSSSTASSSSSSNSRAPSSNEGDGPSRKIRFAPLPAPRRLDLPSVFYESDSESPLNHPPTSHSPSDSNSQQPPSPRPPSLSLLNTDDSAARPKSRTWGQKLLRPLLQPLLPSSTTGDESYSALFRISSRDSTRTNPDLSDDCPVPLARRMSTGSRAPSSTKEADRPNVYTDGAPLMPVMSDGFSSKGRKEGQRMLNGRVYGRRASASQSGKQAAYEPEFVEWGYGGMGSVASSQVRSRSGPDWAKLQSNGKVLGGNTDVDEEGDDGSGMGWVKRRRAQREQEEKAREARAEPGPDQSLPDIAVHPPEPTDHKDASRPLHRQGSNQSNEEHHIYRAVSVPASHHHHIRHHSHHKPADGSETATPTSSPPLSRGNSPNSVPLVRAASTSPHGELLPATAERLEDAEASSSSSSRSSASIDDEDEEEEEDDTERESSDDEDEDDAEGRITSRCAGVEKISRHKE
ncbi:hypothetical protein JB92DRAFT_2912979 [Gautieria morchelliformis]|nr:hypothetical protein JB92DRAFT_2912979 [Gautieria morchelliformis]